MSIEIILVLQYLLPGFVAGAVFYGLTSYYKPSPFERVVQALIFTYLIRGIIEVIGYFIKQYEYTGNWWYQEDFLSTLHFLIALPLAIVLGAVMSVFANNDKFHELLRFLKFTKENSFPAKSEWKRTFAGNVKHIVLHLNDDRRIYGWPKEWPTDQKGGYFLLQDVNWLGEDNEYIPMEGVESMLISSEDVKRVEFMKPKLNIIE